jgi:hypothetical protein
MDALLEKNKNDWFVREVIAFLGRSFSRLDLSSRSMFAIHRERIVLQARFWSWSSLPTAATCSTSTKAARSPCRAQLRHLPQVTGVRGWKRITVESARSP